jgi:hypothetical protein
VRPALRAILAAREPLPVEILQRLFQWRDEELCDSTRPLASLFPILTDAGHDIIKPYHKSLADWFADDATSGDFFVSVTHGHDIEYPNRAQVMTVGPNRVTIMVEDPDDGGDRFIRHVAAERLQPVAGCHEKAVNQPLRRLKSAASWGRFTRYLEVGKELRAVRRVDSFENGNMLNYDRVHWVDDFGMLADAKINRNRKEGPRGRSEEIEPAEFEPFWTAALASLLWQWQVATAQMARMGAVPVWFTIKGRLDLRVTRE